MFKVIFGKMRSPATPVFIVTLLICDLLQCQAQDVDPSTQQDLIGYIAKKFKKNPDSTREHRKVYFSLFPSQASGTKTVVTAINAAFMLGDPATTNASSVLFIPYTNLGNRFGFLIRPNIWLRNNSWNFTGDYRILSNPQEAWRLGGSSPAVPMSTIHNDYVRFYQNALKGIAKNWVAGLAYDLDYHYNISAADSVGENMITGFPISNSSHTISSGFALQVLFDSRKNSINPQGGEFFLSSYRFNPIALGSTSAWQSLYVDARKYFPFSKSRQNLLALRSYYWTILSGQVPYLDLPAIGWDQILGQSGRGTRLSRYRSNAIIYLESEYRIDLTTNGLFGAVVFGNVFSPSEYDTQNFSHWHGALGVGMRVKFNKYSRTNVALDVAASTGYTGVYLYIGEAF